MGYDLKGTIDVIDWFIVFSCWNRRHRLCKEHKIGLAFVHLKFLLCSIQRIVDRQVSQSKSLITVIWVDLFPVDHFLFDPNSY